MRRRNQCSQFDELLGSRRDRVAGDREQVFVGHRVDEGHFGATAHSSLAHAVGQHRQLMPQVGTDDQQGLQIIDLGHLHAQRRLDSSR